jgi:hypothetical protein
MVEKLKHAPHHFTIILLFGRFLVDPGLTGHEPGH